MKVCNDCGFKKPSSDFQKKGKGLQPYCRDCNNRRQRKYQMLNREAGVVRKRAYYLKNKDLIRIKNKKWREENKEYIKAAGRAYRKNNPDKLLQRNRRYREENRLKVNAYDSKYRRERTQKDLNYKIRNGLRSRLSVALRDYQKTGSAVRDLGCSIPELKMYLENLFQQGMSWENYGKGGWHIDHIRPLVSFDLTDREEFLKACHYSNLQPLWEKDNLRKGAKVA